MEQHAKRKVTMGLMESNGSLPLFRSCMPLTSVICCVVYSWNVVAHLTTVTGMPTVTSAALVRSRQNFIVPCRSPAVPFAMTSTVDFV